MNIEVKGATFINKGAALMLCAIRKELSTWPCPVTPGVHIRTGSFAQRHAAGFAHVARLQTRKLAVLEAAFAGAAETIPGALRRRLNLVLAHEIDVVLDASGFCYSDQWGVLPVQRMVKLSAMWHRWGTRIILLPQAFGPFENPAVRTAMRRILQNADLVFARDHQSLQNLVMLDTCPEKLALAPDFTSLVEVVPPSAATGLTGTVVVIPNQRMLDKTEAVLSRAYLSFLENCVSAIRALRLQPVILIHETRDRSLGHALKGRCGDALRMVFEPDPLRIKALLASPKLVISSRFHGLVSALSQGTPAVATGWSHKYELLLRDYGSEDSLWQSTMQLDEIKTRLRSLLDDAHLKKWRRRLLSRADAEKAKSRAMWSRVRDLLGVSDLHT